MSGLSAGIYGLVGSLIGGAASIGGVFANQSMARRAQRQQWLSECKKQECRELLDALSGAYIEYLKIQHMVPSSSEEETKREDAKTHSIRIMRDRIYIGKEFDAVEVSNKWILAMETQYATLKPEILHQTYDEICEIMREIAVNA